MHPSTVQVGQPARIELPDKQGIGIRVAVVAYKDGHFQLMMEESVAPPPELSVAGTPVVMSVVSRVGLHTIRGNAVRTQQRVLIIRVVGDFQTQQQRQYFRVAFNEKVLMRVVNSAVPGLTGKSDEAVALDLSAGGMRVTTKLGVQDKDSVTVQFALDSDKLKPPVSFECAVRRSVPASPTTHTVGLQFLSLSMREQDRLVAFLLKRQAGPV